MAYPSGATTVQSHVKLNVGVEEGEHLTHNFVPCYTRLSSDVFFCVSFRNGLDSLQVPD